MIKNSDSPTQAFLKGILAFYRELIYSDWEKAGFPFIWRNPKENDWEVWDR